MWCYINKTATHATMAERGPLNGTEKYTVSFEQPFSYETTQATCVRAEGFPLCKCVEYV